VPETDRLITTAQAAKIIGVKEALFESLAAEYPWLRPVMVGTGKRKLKRWRREGVRALLYILDHTQENSGRA